MGVSTSEVQALIAIIDKHYHKIYGLESEHDIFGREGDFRPRIEYYHDAIRAFTSGENDPYSKYDRLAPERIAHDVSILRNIQKKPLYAGRGNQHHSTSLELSTGNKNNNIKRPDREIRQTLSGLYKDYTVLFVAILAEKVEDNVQLRSEEADILTEECMQMSDMIAAMEQGSLPLEAVINAAETLENDDLSHLITQILQQGKPTSQNMKKLVAKLQAMRQQMVEEKNAIDQASMNFASGQLAVYEESQDIVKKMAAQGLNIAGKFVENAVAKSTGRDQGRGI